MKLNKKVVAVASLGALVLVGGTFAYFNQTMSLDNPLDTGKYNTQLVEQFTPPGDKEELKPGQRWEKDVWAENTGDYPVLVRIRMDERWMRKPEDGGSVGDPYKVLGSVNGAWDATAGKYVPADGLGVDNRFLAGVYDSSVNTFDAAQVEDSDGETPAEDGTVVYKNIVNSDKWVAGGDGYWYWNGVLDRAGTETSKTALILDDLVVAKDIDLGKYEHKEYYAIAENQPAADDAAEGVWKLITEWNGETDPKTIIDWAKTLNIPEGQKLWRKSESNVIENLYGYSNSYYTLTITSDFVQATNDAMKSSWNVDLDWLKSKGIKNIQLDTDNVSLVNGTNGGSTEPTEAETTTAEPTEAETTVNE